MTSPASSSASHGKLREQALHREEAAAQAAQAREKVVTAQERQAARTRISEESEALAKRSEALDARQHAQTVDDQLEATKAQRKA